MSSVTASPLSELLVRWEEMRRQGDGVSLEELCRANPDLLSAVRAEIQRLESMNALIGMSSDGERSKAKLSAPISSSLPMIDGYEVLGKLGSGGMGIVYKARHQKLNRLVALKMHFVETQLSADTLARFRTEAAAAARLQHPNIVQIHEVGEQDGRPYLALEFVEGGSLAERLAGKPQLPQSAVPLVEILARAVHYAHQRGVVHRDLKPANVLITDDGTLKITDFGLAKKLDEAGQTATGDVIGTPSYMPPEQAAGKVHEIGPAADVYALGAILYEFLTGRPPFRGVTVLDTLKQVQNQEPVPPSRLLGNGSRDLDTICLKCLEKEPRKRYADAAALAEDLRRFCVGEPIRARSPSPLERCVKWVRRHPGRTALVSVIALATALMVGVLAVSNFRVKGALEETSKALDRERLTAYYRQIALADHEWQASNVLWAEKLLDECPTGLRRWEWHYLKRLCQDDVDSKLQERTTHLRCVAYHPNGRLLAAGGYDGTVTIWDVRRREPILTLRSHMDKVLSVAFSPDGQWILSGSNDRTARLWDARTGRELRTIREHLGEVNGVAFSPDGRRFVTGSGDQTVKVWDTKTGDSVQTCRGHVYPVTAVVFSPDGEKIASVGGDGAHGEIKIWEAASGRESLSFGNGARAYTSAAMSPDGLLLVTGDSTRDPRLDEDCKVRVWDTATGRQLYAFRGHSGPVEGVAFSPDGRRIASGSTDATLRIWDADGGGELHTFHTRTDISAVAYSPNGQHLAAGRWDGAVKIWDATTGQEALTLRGEGSTVFDGIAFSPDGRHLAGGCGNGTLVVWDVAKGESTRTFRGHVGQVHGTAFHPGGNLLASAGWDQTVRVWSVEQGSEVLVLRGHNGPVTSVTYSADGTRLASTGRDTTVRVWEAATGRELHRFEGHKEEARYVAFSSDGLRLISGGRDRVLNVWDLATGRAILTISGRTHEINSIAFSPDGRRIVLGSDDRTLQVWDAMTGEEIYTCRGHALKVTSVAFHPDGTRIASGSDDKTVRIWDAASGKEVLSLRGHRGGVTSVTFDKDGHRLASSSWDGTVKLWDARPLDERSSAIPEKE